MPKSLDRLTAYDQVLTANDIFDPVERPHGKMMALEETKNLVDHSTQAHIFANKEELDAFVNEQKALALSERKVKVGDNLYITDTGVPDYWWTGEEPWISELETGAVKVDVDDALNASSANPVQNSVVTSALAGTLKTDGSVATNAGVFNWALGQTKTGGVVAGGWGTRNSTANLNDYTTFEYNRIDVARNQAHEFFELTGDGDNKVVRKKDLEGLGGGADLSQCTEIAIGYGAKGSGQGVAVGSGHTFEYCGEVVGCFADGSTHGVAVGYGAYGPAYGVAVGHSARSCTYGVAVGYDANGNTHGTAVGAGANGNTHGTAVGAGTVGGNCGVAVGRFADGCANGVAVGYCAYGSNYGVAVGSGTEGSDHRVAIGYGAKATDDTPIVIGSSCGNYSAAKITVSRDGVLRVGGNPVGGGGGSGAGGFDPTSLVGIELGRCSNADGNCGVAVGFGAKAGTGVTVGFMAMGAGDSVAVGSNTFACSNESVSIGSSALAPANGSVAIGFGATAPVYITSGGEAVSIGYVAQTYYKDSVAVGARSGAGESAIAVGKYSSAHTRSITIGVGASTSGPSGGGERNIAIGEGAMAYGGDSVTIGNDIGNALAKSAMLSAFNKTTGTHAFLRIIAGESCTDTYLEFGKFDTLSGEATSVKIPMDKFSLLFTANGGVDGVTQGIVGGNSMYGYNG